MKLLNNTPVPDAVLEAVLIKAGRAVGAKTTAVVVQVNRGTRHCHGIACECNWVRWKGARKLVTECGAFRLALPILDLSREKNPHVAEHKRKNWDPLIVAESFFRIARHEWGHIRDFQARDRWRLAFSRGSRRPQHDRRPEEIRTENYADDADRRGRGVAWASEEILALGIALERYRDWGAV